MEWSLCSLYVLQYLILKKSLTNTVKDNVKGFLHSTLRRRTTYSPERFSWKRGICKEWFSHAIARAEDSGRVVIPLLFLNEIKSFSRLCFKRNGKRCKCATMELWIHLDGLLSTQEARVARHYAFSNSYASFLLSNLSHAAITRWLRAARLPFLN